MKLMSLSEWAEKRFTPASRPTNRTLTELCCNGDLPARKVGRKWFIDIEADSLTTGNDLADMVLNDSAR